MFCSSPSPTQIRENACYSARARPAGRAGLGLPGWPGPVQCSRLKTPGRAPSGGCRQRAHLEHPRKKSLGAQIEMTEEMGDASENTSGISTDQLQKGLYANSAGGA
ncbi:hypothetical protein HPB47_002546 [Ixodes persulcatus]|uniref:Uncharacterized protein n=1 Tax=Ixodes persulcatus TaxID=34615 RepID=A0AC60PL00_IXOPE|nr:hypothetical protein HPB47_002546 [Ixodes persulcatus]